MADSAPQDLSLAVGQLIGTVSGLVKAVDEQNKGAAESRREAMEIFRGIRADNKESNEKLESHIQEDMVYHGAMNEFVNWKKDSEPKLNTLWDRRNQQSGAWAVISAMGAVVGGLLVAACEYFSKR